MLIGTAVGQSPWHYSANGNVKSASAFGPFQVSSCSRGLMPRDSRMWTTQSNCFATLHLQ